MLSKFPNKTLKVGARVSLSPESEYVYTGGGYSANPVGVSGVVVGINCVEFDHPDDGLRVNWENGMSNTYRNRDYDLIAEGEPGYLATE